MSRDLLLEIGCENLPPHAIRAAFEQLGRDMRARLDELRLPFESVYTTGTPRRLAVVVRGLADAQTVETETVTGPPWSKAFDESGQPTKAAEGFARSHGVDPTKLGPIPTERGEYLGFTRRMKSRRTSVLMKEMLPETIAAIRFPKTMHWEASGFQFGRPIRWIVALLGSQVIPLQVAGVRSGRVSYSIPWIHRRGVSVKSVTTYAPTMKRAGVILDHGDRRDSIVRLAQAAAKKEKLRLVEDDALFEELTFMLENPRPLVGAFDEKYLALPAEVVVTAMKSHQRYLAFRNVRGRIVPRFLTFTEGKVGAPAVVRHGNEKVLKARLEDASFYWTEDLKAGPDGLATKLASIVFIEGLGTMKDRAERVARLAVELNRMTGAALDENEIRRAALLAKADLASEMIKDGKEFTKLQGVIGSYYAAESGEPSSVVSAIQEHYMPRSPGDDLPAGPLGALISMADRLDTIAGCFLAGFVPSGSQDPYALRRHANGLLRLLEKRPEVQLAPLLDLAVKAYASTGLADEAKVEETTRQIVAFMQSRMSRFLRDMGIAYDIDAAVSAVVWDRPAVAVGRARAMETLRGDNAFELLITGVKRVGNILDDGMKVYGAEWGDLEEAFLRSGRLNGAIRFDTAAFVDEAERGLHTAIVGVVPQLANMKEDTDGPSIIRSLSSLGPVIDNYFDEVLVNTPEESLRRNRHQFLAAVFALFSKYADFSHIVESGLDPA